MTDEERQRFSRRLRERDAEIATMRELLELQEAELAELRAAAEENERLRAALWTSWAALSWIEDQDPQIVAAARDKFGIKDPRDITDKS